MKLKSRPHVMCAKSMLDEIDGVLELVDELARGVGPDKEEVVKWTGFHQLLLKRMEFFYSKEFEAGHAIVKCDQAQIMSGGQALRAHYEEVKLKMSSTIPTAELYELQPLKSFRGVLDNKQAADLKMWTGILANMLVSHNRREADLAKSVNASGVKGKWKDDCAVMVQKAATAATKQSTSSSSSSKPRTTKEQGKEAKNTQTKASMLKFFVPHGKRAKMGVA